METREEEFKHINRCTNMTRLLIARTTDRMYVLEFLLNDEWEEVRTEAVERLNELKQ